MSTPSAASLASTLTSAVLPILSITAAGYLLARSGALDVEPLNTVTLQLLLPALIFHSLATSTLGGTATGQIALGVVLFVAAMGVLAWGAGRLTSTREPLLSALVLASAFPNSGNFGIPLSAFAFGPAGRTTAVLFVTVQNVLVYTAGAFVASRGQGLAGREAAVEVLKLPLIYAAAAALAARWLGIVPPANGAAMSTIELVGDASIPLMLLILGIQLAGMDTAGVARAATPTILKLGVAPAVGLAVVLLLGFDDATVARTFVLECATPAAILPLILTLEYAEGESVDGLTAPEYVSTAVLVTTLASVPVLTVLIVLLRSGTFV